MLEIVIIVTVNQIKNKIKYLCIMGNKLLCGCYTPRKTQHKFICKKCNLRYNLNIRTCPHHKFSKNKTNKSRCVDCQLKKSKYGSSLCYHSTK